MNKNFKLLFAEDDEVSFSILDNFFKKWNYNYVAVKNGDDALQLLQQDNKIKIALLDWMMPGTDGLEICKKMGQIPDRYIYLILLTAKSDNESIIQGLDAGASDYISKPYIPKILRARVDAAVRIVEMTKKLRDFGQDMENLAKERAEQMVHTDRLATIGMLSSGIAHEINNPTAFISVNLQLLEENWQAIEKTIQMAPDSENKNIATNIAVEMPNILGNMKNGVKRIASIVESLKQYYRADKSTKQKWCDIRTVIDESLKICHNRLKNDVQISKKFAGDLPKIRINSQEIEQVFINLFINAADAMENSSQKKLMIDVDKTSQNLEIKVTDTGKGIKEELIQKIFNPFFTTKAKNSGTGMGLSISKNIIDKHKGKFYAKNRNQGGMEFYIKLPLKQMRS